jgi:hypothetical protein
MAEDWYYARGGRRYGPFDFDQLRQMSESGMLSPVDMVKSGPAGEWVSARDVTGLAPIAPPASSDAATEPPAIWRGQTVRDSTKADSPCQPLPLISPQRGLPPPVDRARLWIQWGFIRQRVISLESDVLIVASVGSFDEEVLQSALIDSVVTKQHMVHWAIRIPVVAIIRITAASSGATLSVSYRKAVGIIADKKLELPIKCPSPAVRDKLLAVLRERLGPGWREEFKTESRTAELSSLGYAVVFGIAALGLAMRAVAPPASESGLYHQLDPAFRAVGPWVFLAGGALAVGYVLVRTFVHVVAPTRWLSLSRNAVVPADPPTGDGRGL